MYIFQANTETQTPEVFLYTHKQAYPGNTFNRNLKISIKEGKKLYSSKMASYLLPEECLGFSFTFSKPGVPLVTFTTLF